MTKQAIASLPELPARVHFVGIGGIGMSGLARILHAWGYEVSGSDAHGSSITEALTSEGIAVAIGHADPARATAAHLLVMTAAVRAENSEVAAAAAAGVPIVKRAELLGLLANARDCVAVAGSHGKSTTSGMLVSALTTIGADPSYAVGAIVAATGTNAAPGTGPVMVVEADEYDYSFLWLRPRIAIVTNIDYDHPDLFPDQAAYDDAFAQFAANVQSGGLLVLSADDPGALRLHARVSGNTRARVVTFGESPAADWRLVQTVAGNGVLTPTGKIVPLELSTPGRHNALNAIASVIALYELGIEPVQAATAIAHFRGIGRRFEVRGEVDGIVVVDDYAHHPAEIRATLLAARERYAGRRIVALFQPHTYSRTRSLLENFAAAFGDADLVAILDIYPSRETDTLGISSSDLIARIPGSVISAGNATQAPALLAPYLQPGDVVFTIGAGDVTAVGPQLLALLRARAYVLLDD